MSPFSLMSGEYGKRQCAYVLCWTMEMPEYLKQHGIKWKGDSEDKREGTLNPMFPLSDLGRLPHRLFEPLEGVGQPKSKEWDPEEDTILRGGYVHLIDEKRDDSSGNLIRTNDWRSLCPVDNDFEFSSYEHEEIFYDDKKKPIKIHVGKDEQKVVEIRYDAEGRKSEEAHLDDDGDVDWVMKHLYDDSGNLLYSLDYPAGKPPRTITKYSYNSNTLSGEKVYFTEDTDEELLPSLDQAEESIEKLKAYSTERWNEERYSYNEEGKRIRIDYSSHLAPDPPHEYLEELYDSFGRVAERRKFYSDGSLDYRTIEAYSGSDKAPKVSITEENGLIDDITVYEHTEET